MRRNLSIKGVAVSIMCPMCHRDIEHLLHVFFDCEFAVHCWNWAGLNYDMGGVEYAPSWLLQKLSSAPSDESIKICTVFWGIWFGRNKKVWDDKLVSPTIAIEGSFKIVADWREARKSQHRTQQERQCIQKQVCRVQMDSP